MTFSLLETMRLDDGRVARVDRHIRRMAGSAGYFGYPWNERAVRSTVMAEAARHPAGRWRMRLLLAPDGTPRVECTPIPDEPPRIWRVAFAAAPVDDRDPFLRNKTTNRGVYERARLDRPDLDDVVLWNSRLEVTESTIANVVVGVGGSRFTPPVSSGLLPGVFRSVLLDEGVIQERVLTREEVAGAERFWLINSVREWIEAELV
jgi:para-aminobenzoate synthetase/4-amino-4-deoxychorismate lyase